MIDGNIAMGNHQQYDSEDEFNQAQEAMQNKLRTPAEIDNLFRQWKDDPCWDLETTEGFEMHREQLLNMSNDHKEKCERLYQQRRAPALMKIVEQIGNDQHSAVMLGKLADFLLDMREHYEEKIQRLDAEIERLENQIVNYKNR